MTTEQLRSELVSCPSSRRLDVLQALVLSLAADNRALAERVRKIEEYPYPIPPDELLEVIKALTNRVQALENQLAAKVERVGPPYGDETMGDSVPAQTLQQEADRILQTIGVKPLLPTVDEWMKEHGKEPRVESTANWWYVQPDQTSKTCNFWIERKLFDCLSSWHRNGPVGRGYASREQAIDALESAGVKLGIMRPRQPQVTATIGETEWPSDKAEFDAGARTARAAIEPILEQWFGKCTDYDCSCEGCRRWKLLDQLLQNPFDDTKPQTAQKGGATICDATNSPKYAQATENAVARPVTSNAPGSESPVPGATWLPDDDEDDEWFCANCGKPANYQGHYSIKDNRFLCEPATKPIVRQEATDAPNIKKES